MHPNKNRNIRLCCLFIYIRLIFADAEGAGAAAVLPAHVAEAGRAAVGALWRVLGEPKRCIYIYTIKNV